MPWDFIANIGQQQNIGQGKSYWLSGPYTIYHFTLNCTPFNCNLQTDTNSPLRKSDIMID